MCKSGIDRYFLKLQYRHLLRENITRYWVASYTTQLASFFTGEFATFLTICRSMRFDDTPDYLQLRQLFVNLFHRSGYTSDCIYDWNLVSCWMHSKLSCCLCDSGILPKKETDLWHTVFYVICGSLFAPTRQKNTLLRVRLIDLAKHYVCIKISTEKIRSYKCNMPFACLLFCRIVCYLYELISVAIFFAIVFIFLFLWICCLMRHLANIRCMCFR